MTGYQTSTSASALQTRPNLGGTLKGGPQLADRAETADHIHKMPPIGTLHVFKLCCCLRVRS